MPTELPNLDETVVATARYLQALTELGDADAREPSLLPGWSRAHLITHLARNADALAAVLRGAQAGRLVAMYESQERRDAEIEAGAARPWEELRGDAVESSRRWQVAAEALAPVNLEAPGCRTPGGPTWPVRRVGMMRRSEVEVHHADLGIGYTAAAWPADFVAALMKRRQRELAGKGPHFAWRATDTGDSWSSGEGPTVEGAAADLVWWLLGRGSGDGLSCATGPLPTIGSWA